ncbi:hypothetical protein [Hugenholtzia roseola]|uniref:hypothetical protein n=1 Tax=Hugenholtzia roseola TaxID=1002 RepID=UPI0004038D00|nr:hypothetical protein [Hugenholtzia roseola]
MKRYSFMLPLCVATTVLFFGLSSCDKIKEAAQNKAQEAVQEALAEEGITVENAQEGENAYPVTLNQEILDNYIAVMQDFAGQNWGDKSALMANVEIRQKITDKGFKDFNDFLATHMKITSGLAYLQMENADLSGQVTDQIQASIESYKEQLNNPDLDPESRKQIEEVIKSAQAQQENYAKGLEETQARAKADNEKTFTAQERELLKQNKEKLAAVVNN